VEKRVTLLNIKEISDVEARRFLSNLTKDDRLDEIWNQVKTREKIQKWTPLLLEMLASYVKNADILTNFNVFDLNWYFFNSKVVQTNKNAVTERTKSDYDLMCDHLIVALNHLMGMEKEVDKDAINKVGIARFDGDTLVFNHMTWAEFLVCLAVLSKKSGLLSEAHIFKILTEPQFREVRSFLNMAFGSDFKDADFRVQNFLENVQLEHMLNDAENCFEVLKRACFEDLTNIYSHLFNKRMENFIKERADELVIYACSAPETVTNKGKCVII
jgi:hypothetical protein